jgi:ribosomal protein L21E
MPPGGTKMKKLLSRVSLAAFIALALLIISTFALPCLAAQADASECWAVIAGVSDYIYGDMDLDYCDNDAQDLYDVLSPIWGDSHIRLFKDWQANKANILAGISWMAENANANDTVFFSFSGHGSGSGDGYFCPADSLTDSAANYISSIELANAFAAVDASNIVVVLDTCFSGMFANNMSEPGRVIMMACRYDETSWEYNDLQNGAYSYFVIQALGNFDLVDTNDDYILSAEEVAAYADTETWQYDYSQTPQLSDMFNGQLALMDKFVFAINTTLPAGTCPLVLDDVNYTYIPGPLIWAPGSEHTLSVVEGIEISTGTRIGFVGWSDGSTSNTIVVTHGSYTANYAKEHLLNIISAFGEPQGAGWQVEGTAAEFFVKPLLETLDTRHYFTGWSGDYSGTSESGSITMFSPATVTANWRNEFLVAINSVYGQPAGAGWYKEGETAPFSVTPYIELPDTRHYFTGWSGSYSGTSEAASLLIDAPKVLTANWRNEYLLQINSEYGSPTGAGWYQEGLTAPFSVTPYVEEADAKHYFTGWKGDYTGTQETASLVMDTPKAIGATWRNEYLLKVNSAYGNPTGAGWYKEGETARFSVTPYIELPDTKHYFTGWSGSYAGTQDSASLAISAPRTVNANWRHEYLLKINSEYGTPTGAGWYKEGENAPVSVEPVQGTIIRQVFDGWSGDFTDTQSSAAVPMNSPKVITAKWHTDLMQLYMIIGGVVVLAGIVTGAVVISRRGRAL